MQDLERFLKDARKLVHTHSPDVTFTTVTTGAYDVELGYATNTETSETVKAFPKKVLATQYNAPSLVGQTLTEFLVLAPDLTVEPKSQDKVTQGTETFTVHSVKKHTMYGVTILYKVLCSAG